MVPSCLNQMVPSSLKPDGSCLVEPDSSFLPESDGSFLRKTKWFLLASTVPDGSFLCRILYQTPVSCQQLLHISMVAMLLIYALFAENRNHFENSLHQILPYYLLMLRGWRNLAPATGTHIHTHKHNTLLPSFLFIFFLILFSPHLLSPLFLFIIPISSFLVPFVHPPPLFPILSASSSFPLCSFSSFSFPFFSSSSSFFLFLLL